MTGFSSSSSLSYEGCSDFRTRIVLSTLSGKLVKIKNIRARNEDPGLAEFEASFLRLMDKLTNGTRIEVNETGTSVVYVPGLLMGGVVEHACSLQRGIGYYLEYILMLAPFCKKPLQLTLKGITNNQMDSSVDQLKHSSLPILRRQLLLADEQLELRILRRGMAPAGGGVVIFRCPVQKTLRALQWVDMGRVKRVRGVAYGVRVSPAMAARMVETAKQQLQHFTSDVYIYTDQYRGDLAGKSPGFGISLVAEGTTGSALVSDVVSNPKGSQQPPSVPEQLGTEAALSLLDQIHRGGCVDSTCQSLVLLYMALGQKDVSKVTLGRITPFTMDFLRYLRDFFSTVFRIENATHSEQQPDNCSSCTLTLTCIGSGFTNLSKTVS